MNDYTDRQEDSKKDPMSGIDFISSIIWIVFSLGMVRLSLKLPRPEGWGSAPGLIPLFVSTSMFFMGLGLLISSIKNKGFSQVSTVWRGVNRIKAKRFLWIILLTAFYIFVLLDRVIFELASFIYLASVFYVFWKKGGWVKIIFISILLPFFASGVFGIIFEVFMPGGSFFDWLFGYFK